MTKIGLTERKVQTDVNDLAEYQIGRFIWTYVMPVILLVGTVGSVLSLMILCRPTVRKKSTTFYLTVLAVSDLLVLYVGLTRGWLQYSFGIFIRNQSNVMCKLQVFLNYVVWHLSAWIPAAVSGDRAVLLVWPHWAKQNMTVVRSGYVVAAILTVLSLVNAHYLWTVNLVVMTNFTAGALGDSYNNQRCYFDHSIPGVKTFHKKVQPWINLNMFFFIPFLVMAISDVILVRQLFIYERILSNHLQYSMSFGSSHAESTNVSEDLTSPQETKSGNFSSRVNRWFGRGNGFGSKSLKGKNSKKNGQNSTGNINGTQLKYGIDANVVETNALSSVNHDIDVKRKSSIGLGGCRAGPPSNMKSSPLCFYVGNKMDIHKLDCSSGPGHVLGGMGDTEIHPYKFGNDVFGHCKTTTNNNSDVDDISENVSKKRSSGNLSPVKSLAEDNPALNTEGTSAFKDTTHGQGLTVPLGYLAGSVASSRLAETVRATLFSSLMSTRAPQQSDSRELEPSDQDQRLVGSDDPDVDTQHCASAAQRERLRSRRQSVTVAKILLAVTLVFMELNLPIAIYWLVVDEAEVPTTSDEAAVTYLVWAVVNCLAYTNSASHFFLYCLASSKFRKELRAVLKAVRHGSCRTERPQSR